MAGEEQDDGYTDIAKQARHEPADRMCVRRDEVHDMNLPEDDLRAWCPPCCGTFRSENRPYLQTERDVRTPGVDPALAKVLIDNEKSQGLREWWLDLASSEVEPLIAKAIEYGGEGRALDLIEIGRALVTAGVKLPNQRIAPWPDDKKGMLDADYAELGIYFYLQGKFARWTAAIAEGRPVSDDTLLDIGIYVRMAQRIREVGGWPV